MGFMDWIDRVNAKLGETPEKRDARRAKYDAAIARAEAKYEARLAKHEATKVETKADIGAAVDQARPTSAVAAFEATKTKVQGFGDKPERTRDEKRAAATADLNALKDQWRATHWLQPITLDLEGIHYQPMFRKQTVPVAGARARVEVGGQSRGLGLGAMVPVGPVGVGIGGGRSRADVYLVIDHADGQWQVKFEGKKDRKVRKMAAAINTAAHRAERARATG